MARFSFSFDRGIIRPAALLLVLCLLFAGFSGRAPVRAEDLYDDVYPEEEEVLEPLGPDSDENLSRFEQGLPTGLWYSELLADESREVWGTFWEVNDGVLYDTRFHALLWYPDDKTDAVYEVLPGTLYIAAGALGAAGQVVAVHMGAVGVLVLGVAGLEAREDGLAVDQVG